jgi:hypothetical protein
MGMRHDDRAALSLIVEFEQPSSGDNGGHSYDQER